MGRFPLGDIIQIDEEPMDKESKNLSWKLLEWRHLLETGRRTAKEVRKEMWRYLNDVPPPPFSPLHN